MLHTLMIFLNMIDLFFYLQFSLLLCLIILQLQFVLLLILLLNHPHTLKELCHRILHLCFYFLKIHQEKFFSYFCLFYCILTLVHHDLLVVVLLLQKHCLLYLKSDLIEFSFQYLKILTT